MTEVLEVPVGATNPAPADSTSCAEPRRRPSPAGLGLIVAAAAAWTAVLGAAASWRHNQFLSHRFDLGNMVQAVWSTTQGRPLEMTDAATGEQITRLGAHVDPILVLVAPLWWIYPSPETLLVVQAAALAAGLYPAVCLALKYTHSTVVSFLVGAWYLVFPWTVWVVFDEFHPVTLAIPLLLYAIWFLDDSRFGFFAVFAGLAMLAGELIGLTVAALGVWYAIRYGRRVVGGLVALAGTCWTAICVAVIVPAFNHGEPSRYYERFDSVGGSPVGLLATLFTDPRAILEQITGREDLLYLLWLLAPAAFLALLTPLLLVAALPQLAVNVLAEWSSTTVPITHYVSAIVPVVVAASIIALARFSIRGQVLTAGAAFGASVVFLVAYPPVPGSQTFVFPEQYPPERRAALREAVAFVPASAPVSATNRLGAHLSERRIIQLFPELSGAEWAVIDLRNPWLPGFAETADPRIFGRAVERLDRDPDWELQFARAGVRIYERVGVSG